MSASIKNKGVTDNYLIKYELPERQSIVGYLGCVVSNLKPFSENAEAKNQSLFIAETVEKETFNEKISQIVSNSNILNNS